MEHSREMSPSPPPNYCHFAGLRRKDRCHKGNSEGRCLYEQLRSADLYVLVQILFLSTETAEVDRMLCWEKHVCGHRLVHIGIKGKFPQKSISADDVINRIPKIRKYWKHRKHPTRKYRLAGEGLL